MIVKPIEINSFTEGVTQLIKDTFPSTDILFDVSYNNHVKTLAFTLTLNLFWVKGNKEYVDAVILEAGEFFEKVFGIGFSDLIDINIDKKTNYIEVLFLYNMSDKQKDIIQTALKLQGYPNRDKIEIGSMFKSCTNLTEVDLSSLQFALQSK